MAIPCVPGMPAQSIRALFRQLQGGKPNLANETGQFGPAGRVGELAARAGFPGGGTRISGLSVGLAFIRRNSCCVALGFALGQFLLLLLLFFLGPCAGRPVSLRSISTVVWLECHRILLCAG
jgi:hypothetical protein